VTASVTDLLFRVDVLQRDLVEKNSILQSTQSELQSTQDKLKSSQAEVHLTLSRLKRAEDEVLKTKQAVAAVFAGPSHVLREQPSELVGVGYGTTAGNKTFYRHASTVIDLICKLAKDDPLKQFELARQVYYKLSGETTETSVEEQAKKDILESLKLFHETLVARNPGRFPNSVRAAVQAVSAAVSATGDSSMAARSRLLGIPAEQLLAGRQKWESFLADEGQLTELRGAIRSDKIPDEWLDFLVEDVWLGETRQSEKARDSCRNPHDRSDKETYRWHFLEMRREDLYAIAVAKGRARFGPNFKCSSTVFYQLEPFQIHKPGRSTSLCRYHLQFEFFASALFQYRKKRRDHGIVTCDCNTHSPANAYDLRKVLICDRADGVGIEVFFDKRECVQRSCTVCGPGMKLLTICDHEVVDDGSAWCEVTFQRWQKVEYLRKDGSESDKFDFVQATLHFTQFFEEMNSCFDSFILHHDLARWLDEDYQVQSSVRPGHASATQDFAENFTHEHKLEHTAKYFNTKASTIYPMVLETHLDDLTNISQDEKIRLRTLFDQHKLPHVISEAIVVISPDLNHTAANVIHFNDHILIPYLKKNAPAVHTLHVRSDGARSQYKQSKLFLWISKHKSSDGLCIDWSFFCSCHGKAKCDPVGGGCKSHAKRQELASTLEKPTLMPQSSDLFRFLQDTYMEPRQTLFEKRGRGIYRRVFFYVPQTGEGSVNYRIAECGTLDGSSSLHQFRDIGLPERLRVRTRSCHHCDSCWDGRWSECRYIDIVGTPTDVRLSPASDPAPRITRNLLAKRGAELCKEVGDGEFIAAELDSENEAWMLCMVRGRTYVVDKDFTSTIGQHSFDFRCNDTVIDVQKLEPIAPGSRIFQKVEKTFPLFVEDVRVTRIVLHEVPAIVRARREAAVSNPHAPAPPARFELAVADKERILEFLPVD
jgi:hypothetical protein